MRNYCLALEFEILSVPITAVSNHFKCHHRKIQCLKIPRLEGLAWQALLSAPKPTAA